MYRKGLSKMIPQCKVRNTDLSELVNLKSQRGIYNEVYNKKEQRTTEY